MTVKKKKIVKKPEKIIIDGFLFCRKELDVKALSEALEDAKVTCECWPEMGVIEIPLLEAGSIDLERSEITFEGEDQIFLENHDIKGVYEISFPKNALSQAGAAFRALVDATSGVICSDTEDFYPVYAGNF